MKQSNNNKRNNKINNHFTMLSIDDIFGENEDLTEDEISSRHALQIF